MFRSLIAITVGVTALCFARVPQEQTKAGSDPFGSSTEQSKESTSKADTFGGPADTQGDGEDPFGQTASPAKGGSESPSTASVTFVVNDGPIIEWPIDPIAQATSRLKQLEKEYKNRETQVIDYAASMHKKYTGQATFPITVRQALSKMIETALVARGKLQRQRIQSARLRLDASEARLSKALTRSSFVVKRRVEQLLGKQPEQALAAQKETERSSKSGSSAK